MQYQIDGAKLRATFAEFESYAKKCRYVGEFNDLAKLLSLLLSELPGSSRQFCEMPINSEVTSVRNQLLDRLFAQVEYIATTYEKEKLGKICELIDSFSIRVRELGLRK